MFHILFCLCCWHLIGVFGDSVSVMEGESVTLNTDLTEIHEGDDILWKYGAEKPLIAKIKRAYGIFSTFDVPDGRFRDRLKLDDQTGSLTITNITTEHAGLFKVKIRRAAPSKQFSASVYAVTVRLPQTVSHSSPHPPVSLYRIVLICVVAAAAGSLLVVAAVGMYCLCKNCRKRATTQEEDITDSDLCKPTIQNMKSKMDAVHENVPKKQCVGVSLSYF